jgi:amino acid adenylation domain-containing protein
MTTEPSNGLKEISGNYLTVVDVLRSRSFTQPDSYAFTFLQDGETEEATLTYQELDRRSRAIAQALTCQFASQLQALRLSGKRALLLYPPGLDYLAAFFGCLYAGVVAVPAYPPRNKRNTPRIQAIVSDAQVSVALTTTAILPTVQSLLTDKADLETLHWLTTDNLAQGIEQSWQEPLIHTDTLAFLQYTSGSTGTPKGVMLSHGNLLHNAATTYQFMEHSPSSKFVSWLPAYHDMGLIGGILQPLYGGFPCILMPPASFLQRPYRWLQAISHYKGTTSGGPNFAYELCVEKITPEQKETLDLSSWSVAFNGAEPIRSDTLERFAAAFASCGFRKEAFYPCYGMAEATLMISGSQKAASPVIKTVQKAALERNQVVEAVGNDEDVYSFVGCGQTIPQQQIVIAHPETLRRCQPDEVGEIWVSGPSVGKGYWNRTVETEQTFYAYLKDTGEGPFLRTGDLGFLHNGEVFITGRAKDLIIIRGRNLYPQDIELTAERSHPSLRLGSGAAFTVEVDNEERLVVVQELEFRAKPNVEEATAAIRQAVTEEHEVQVYAVVLIKPGSIPKTSSGKIQRRACKAEFLADCLEVVSSSILETVNFVENQNNLKRETLLALTPRECQPLLESYLVEQVARVLLIAPSQINSEQRLSTLGLDSLRVFELKNRIENELEVVVSIADFFEGVSTRALATKIVAELTAIADMPSVPVTKVQKATDFHPLSFGQRQLWFIHQLAPDTPAYNIPIAIKLKGCVNVTALTQSLNEIIRRHEVLRTNFALKEGEPVQVIKQAATLSLSIEDLRELSESDRIKEAQRLATDIATQPFDLSCQLLLRGLLLRLADKEYRLLLTLHHIVSDAWSIGVFIRELAALYEAFDRGKPSPLPKLPIQYVDFAYWQRQTLQGERIQSLLAYWKQQLGGKLPVLNLPTDRPRSPLQTFRGGQTTLVLPHTLTAALKNLSHQEGVTLFMTLLAAFKTLLYRYTGQTDILVGSPIASRNRAEIESLIGFFVNVLVLRTDLSSEPSFRELLRRVRQVALDAYVNQDLPFEKLVEELHPERDLSYNPLFQVMFVLQNVPIPTPKLSDISITCQEGYNGTAKFDLTVFMQDTEEGLVATVEYNTDLFHTDTINRMLGHFSTLLDGIVANPDNAIGNLPLLTASEKQQLIVEFNNTKTDFPSDKCLHQLFEAQVERTPDAVAVVFENEQLTYHQLNQRVNQLAYYLQKLGVQPEVPVGICVERSITMLIGLLGILKAGGVYVPLDPAYPQERLAFMLEDAQAPILLTQKHLVESLPKHTANVVCLDQDWQAIAQESRENPVNSVIADNLAYVIYTSGSTGKPKGTLIHHRGLVNYLAWCSQAYKVYQGEGAPVHSSMSFDMTITGLFSPLLVGNKVELLPENKGIETLAQTLRNKSNYSLVKITPAQLALLSQQLSSTEAKGKTNAFIIGGENLLTDSITFWQNFAPDTILVNEYGPTETVVGCCIYQVPQGKINSASVPIGQPIANTQLYVLNQYYQPVPIGVPGELYIGGVGVARGYLNRPELTAEKFVPNPFSKEPGTRLYKTGDLVRYCSDGNLEFLGRIDHQVKVRGYRIELEEIEALLRQYPGVQDTIVLMREDVPGDQRLVVYYVAKADAAITISNLRNFLKEQLPDYMMPSAFVPMQGTSFDNKW